MRIRFTTILAAVLAAGFTAPGTGLALPQPASPPTVQEAGPAQKADPTARPGQARTVLLDAASLERSVDRLRESLGALRAVSRDERLPRSVRKTIGREIARVAEEIDELRRRVREAPDGIPAPTDVVVVTGPSDGLSAAPDVSPDEAAPPMTREAFEEALASLDRHGFASEKLAVLGELATHNWFLVEQARRLLEAFSFGKDRLQALERLAPRIVDPQNNFRLYEAFTFESDKSQARRILAAQQP